MSTLAQKMDKQFDYQCTRFGTSADPMDLFVSVEALAAYLATQTRADQGETRGKVKAELEHRADGGRVRRWVSVHGTSLRQDRADHYFLIP